MKVFILSLASGLFLWPVVGSAELYKWTDEQGTFHITDTPPLVPHKKSTVTAVPAPRSTFPKKTMVRPTLPGQPRAQVHPVPSLIVPSPSIKEVSLQQILEGLNPNQATLTSSWHVFEGTQASAKAPVQRWKDEQGLDHFVDVLPEILGKSEATPKPEDVSASPSTRRIKERATVVSRSRHRSVE